MNCGEEVDHQLHVHDFAYLSVNTCMEVGRILGALAWTQGGAVIGYGVQQPECAVLKPSVAL